jgi:hypothetical protein
MSVTIHSVLAGAYGHRGRLQPTRPESLLTHASLDDGDTATCKRVKQGNLCDYHESGPPTCPTCQRRLNSVWPVEQALRLMSMAQEIRRRRAADDAVRIDKAVADAAIALELAREAMMASVGMDCPTYETCMAYETCKHTLLAAIHVAVTFRDDPAHGRISEAISKLDVK